MQNGFALSVSDKQLIKTFFITFIAVVAGLPVASALMPTRENALAQDNAVKSAVSKTAEELGLGACGTATGTGAKKTSSSHTHEVVTRTVSQNGNNNQNGTNNSQNNGGATAQVGRDGIAASVNALNDVVDVNDVLDLNVGNVSVPVLSNNNTPVLSNNSNGGLLGLGILGL